MKVKVVKHFPEGDVIIKDETVKKEASPRKKKTSPKKKEETLSDEDDCQTEQKEE